MVLLVGLFWVPSCCKSHKLREHHSARIGSLVHFSNEPFDSRLNPSRQSGLIVYNRFWNRVELATRVSCVLQDRRLARIIHEPVG